MDRMNEYQALLQALSETPPALEGSVARAKAKDRRRRAGRWCGIPMASLGGLAAAFVLLVNFSLPFARACGNIPFLKDLAAAVAFSPSLKAAVEHDYVQPIGQSQTVNDVTMTVEYLIVDQKQVNIFFSLKSDAYTALWGDPEVLEPDGETGGRSVGWRSPEDGSGLQQVVVNYLEGDTPDALTLRFKVMGDRERAPDEPIPAPDALSGSSGEPLPEREYVAEFTFDLDFDPAFTETGETISLGTPFTLDGQDFTAHSVEIYPTHVRLNLSADPANTAWLKGLDFYLTDENGNRYDKVSNGISATGTGDAGGMTSFRLESSYFGRAEHLTVHIAGCTWLDRDREYVTLDLAQGKALSPLPDGVTLGAITRRGSMADIVLFGKAPEGNDETHLISYQIAASSYRTPDGEEHAINAFSSSHSGEVMPADGSVLNVPEGCFAEQFQLVGCTADTVELKMVFSRMSTFETPVEIPVK
ncbi:DUF4179 domain-containing protein [Pseudoflavonifractor phocaeensis]|uniref:DUF4179 domain-containing protein n=1 Tax=Pseudoflavonifractor phocaeensis TaxID=1870988 RepID=UPI002108FF6A|nr:DUF4179 domain-containing protein [Pseudoflavonifractor phocaeensis]MCQ4865484.1 DUF4179 domain-containing protein [Pseudoflavonifractor phocaeensis]